MKKYQLEVNVSKDNETVGRKVNVFIPEEEIQTVKNTIGYFTNNTAGGEGMINNLIKRFGINCKISLTEI